MFSYSIALMLALITSKELRRGIITVIGSFIVFTPVIIIGVAYNLFYPFVMAYLEKDATLVYKIVFRLIKGTLATIGNALYYGLSVPWDIMGNVWGEWLEDSITTEESTPFGESGITISSSIGYLEFYNKPIFKRGKILSKVLNFAFNQKRHAVGSWEKHLALKKLETKNLFGKK